jgi:TolA-binding protein
MHTSRAVVRADSTTLWSERMEGQQEKIVLERGTLWIHVKHSSGETRLVVVLPDGELEDTGTTFSASAEEGHTTRVAVQEGSLVLRVRGQPSVALGPGDAWVPDARPEPVACASCAPSAEPMLRGQVPPPVRSALPRPSLKPLASEVTHDPSVDFRAAIAALDAGDNREAAMAFANFLLEHPHDPRAQDAAYLRVIALQRCDDNGRTKDAALEYLRRYPTGFRHTDVEKLLNEPGK